MTKSSELRRPLARIGEKVDALTVRVGKKSKMRRKEKKMMAGARAKANEARETVQDRYEDLGKRMKRLRKRDTRSTNSRRAATVGAVIVGVALAAALISAATRHRQQQWHE